MKDLAAQRAIRLFIFLASSRGVFRRVFSLAGRQRIAGRLRRIIGLRRRTDSALADAIDKAAPRQPARAQPIAAEKYYMAVMSAFLLTTVYISPMHQTGVFLG